VQQSLTGSVQSLRSFTTPIFLAGKTPIGVMLYQPETSLKLGRYTKRYGEIHVYRRS